MKNSFALVMLSLSIGASSSVMANDRSFVYSIATDKVILSLKADCNLLLKECDRIKQDLDRYDLEFKDFNEHSYQKGGRSNFVNRALIWNKAITSAVEGHLRSIESLYENCMCLSGKIKLTDDLKKLLEETGQKYYRTRNKAMSFKSALTTFKSKIQPNLN